MNVIKNLSLLLEIPVPTRSAFALKIFFPLVTDYSVQFFVNMHFPDVGGVFASCALMPRSIFFII